MPHEQEVMTVADNIAGDALKCDLAIEVLRSFGELRFAATGWSMLPSLWPGDLLMVEKIGADQMRVGEIVLVGRDGKLCAHRLLSRPNDSGQPAWITRGDAMPAPDPPVAEAELMGRVSSVVRKGNMVRVPSKLNAINGLMAKIIRRSFFAACVLVYLQRMDWKREGSVNPCRS